MREEARAKVNLFLHVLGRRPDGWHDLESLAVFAAVGDSLEAEPAEKLSLTVEGPFAAALDPGMGEPSNLVIRAAGTVGVKAAFRLTKRLPVASGLGGGSADAAAALRLAARLGGYEPDDPRSVAAAIALGADVPVCLRSAAAWMAGRGERISPFGRLAPLPAVLVNPGVAVKTPDVFVCLGLPRDAQGPSQPLAGSEKASAGEDLLTFLARTRNDLEPAAIALAPVIGEALALLQGLPGARLVRMSGSGASVFGVFGSVEEAGFAAGHVKSIRPDWWCVATTLS